ncbi:MAG TPA: glycoside hydrolase family 20 zincin-like fold domain-containing protein, partial [Chthonomonadaceae bacterium]|nr:glycoside hydrolase family 20 zincin-like fold domain-containing protein [Chthonomonadaceae bacterium]
MRFAAVLLCAAVLVTAAAFANGQTAAAPAGVASPMKIGRWTARLDRAGPLLDFDDIPLVRGGVIQLFSPDYKRGYFSSSSSRAALSTEMLSDGGRAYVAAYEFAAQGARLEAVQRMEVRADSGVALRLTVRWDGPEPALLEWNAARLWAYPLLGAELQATGPAAVAQTIRIPLRPAPGRAMNNPIATGWSAFRVAGTAYGDLTLTAGGDGQAALLDGRNDIYLQRDRVLWLGFPAVALKPGEERTLTVSLAVSPAPRTPSEAVDAPSRGAPAPAEPSGRDLRVRATIRPAAAAALPPPSPRDRAGHPAIIPQPKRVTYNADAMPLRGTLPLTILTPPGEAGERAARAARAFADEVSARTGVHWRESRAGAPWSGSGLLVIVQGAGTIAPPLTAPAELHAEGYSLQVTPHFAAVIGHDPAGAFYGLQTLRQLLLPAETQPYGRRVPPRFAGAGVDDWPSLRMRAAHIFVGKEALPFHHKLIDRIFARYKLNTLVIECEYTRWKSHPEIWQPFSMEPDDLRQEVAYARDRFMEPIPLINSLGHSEWIFKNGQHLDLAEDVKSPHAYDASNPGTYAFLFGVYGEALDIFRPRWFHIGHDEVHVPSYDTVGRYPARPENVAKGVTELFLEDTACIADWLRPRGVTPILWADMMLYRTEGNPAIGREMVASNAPSLADAERMRAELPKDAIVADWRYEPGSEQRNGLDLFRAAGHDVLGCAWFSPENIRGWARACIEHGAMGTIQTTWAGYDSKEALLDEEYRQFTAFVLAGEYAWSGTELHPRPATPDGMLPETSLLPYDAADVFSAAYLGDPATDRGRRAWRIDLGHAANVALAPAEDAGGFLAAPGRGGMTGVLLAGRLQPAFLPRDGAGAAPQSVTIAFAACARELVFTHACLCGLQEGAPVAA